MTGRSSTKRTGLCLLALLLSCLENVVGEPEPIPSELLYSKNFINNAENLILLNKLKQVIDEKEEIVEQEKTLDDVQMMLQTVLEERAKDDMRIPPGDYSVEEIPTPNPPHKQVQRSGKRTSISYMTLCHFKICNMGRKRQLRE
ncbi:uncharacterized protein LOC126917160 [Bombus affinis]|uniref:uncharacterized protein LOC126917160 n=1 Tax=Bombus affinis TaxID=309941 RepID=UPI0021B7BBA5|nr:uncharacterized protein LOC126917160 [Bombus affinis]XP_050579707.1 uncharacterized protein LOC126917160 [Bombus affinis]